MSVYGDKIESSEPYRASVIGSVETSGAGNVILRVGRQNVDDASWSQTEHVVLTPDEVLGLLHQMVRAMTDNSASVARLAGKSR